jgi:riboflavin transporter FmnP
MSTNIKKKKTLHTVVGIAMFSALAFVVSLIFRIPVLFLTFDAKDAIIAIAGFIYGPIAALIASLIAAALELITVSSTGPYGFVMNFGSSASFSVVAALIYKYRRTFFGSVIGLYTATAVVTAFMVGFNLIVTPRYMGVDVAVVADMIPKVFLPFNLAKALMNSAITMLLYKPVIISLRKARLIEGNRREGSGINRFTLYTAIIGLFTLAVAITIFVILNK